MPSLTKFNSNFSVIVICPRINITHDVRVGLAIDDWSLGGCRDSDLFFASLKCYIYIVSVLHIQIQAMLFITIHVQLPHNNWKIALSI